MKTILFFLCTCCALAQHTDSTGLSDLYTRLRLTVHQDTLVVSGPIHRRYIMSRSIDFEYDGEYDVRAFDSHILFTPRLEPGEWCGTNTVTFKIHRKHMRPADFWELKWILQKAVGTTGYMKSRRSHIDYWRW